MKLFSLNRPARSNQYCGPAVLSFLTGQDTSECASWFRRFSHHRGAVRGSNERNMRLVLTKLTFLSAFTLEAKDRRWPDGFGKTKRDEHRAAFT